MGADGTDEKGNALVGNQSEGVACPFQRLYRDIVGFMFIGCIELDLNVLSFLGEFQGITIKGFVECHLLYHLADIRVGSHDVGLRIIVIEHENILGVGILRVVYHENSYQRMAVFTVPIAHLREAVDFSPKTGTDVAVLNITKDVVNFDLFVVCLGVGKVLQHFLVRLITVILAAKSLGEVLDIDFGILGAKI